MLKDKIEELVNRLIQVTNNGNLVWYEKNTHSLNRKFKRVMISQGEDKTEYEIEIKFQLKNENWQIESDPALWIKNSLLPEGMMMVSYYKSDGLTSILRQSVLDKYCTDMNPSIDDLENTLDEITKGISISEFRDSKINKVLK